MYSYYLLITLLILICIAVTEVINPRLINEGFSNLVSVGSGQWATWMPRRGDVGISSTDESDGFIRDIRYFHNYADVQRIGQDHDFCRMIMPKSSNTNDMFFACALGGTEGLSSIKYRTPSVSQGFEVSRDDYMNDALDEGRDSYCRILKTAPDMFQPICNPADDFSFKTVTIVDGKPPAPIQTLLTFYEGIMFWLRIRDDLLDYAKNLKINIAGGMEIDEVPAPTTQGLAFDGVDQYLRIGDSNDLSFGKTIQLQSMRAVCFWVYFEEFTNNAKIFDFGEAGQPSVFLGIIGRGNPGLQQEVFIKDCSTDETVPDAPSGQQCVLEQSPQVAMITSRANIEEYDCPSPEIFGRIMPPLHQKVPKVTEAVTADLLYEVWDGKMRKLHIQVKNVFPLRKWVHVCLTATSSDAIRPGLRLYVNGESTYTEPSAWLPQKNATTHNYIGKSNTMSVTSQNDNKDELFKGAMFDVRGYSQIMSKKKVKDTYNWGKTLLGLNNSDK
jgi:hypothetical protein